MKTALTPAERQDLDVARGDDPAHDDKDVLEPFGPQPFHHPRHEGQMRPGQQREAHGVCVFLHDGADHLLGCLMQTCVDHLEPGVSQRPGDDLGPSVVAVETGLGHDDAVATFHSWGDTTQQ